MTEDILEHQKGTLYSEMHFMDALIHSYLLFPPVCPLLHDCIFSTLKTVACELLKNQSFLKVHKLFELLPFWFMPPKLKLLRNVIEKHKALTLHFVLHMKVGNVWHFKFNICLCNVTFSSNALNCVPLLKWKN